MDIDVASARMTKRGGGSSYYDYCARKSHTAALRVAASPKPQRLYCCCSHINSHSQVRGHRTGSSHSGAEEYPRGKAQTNLRWYTHMSQLTQLMPPPEIYKSEIGSQPTMCQVHTGAYVPLLAPKKTDYTACHPRKPTTYILHVVPITTHTHDRRKPIGKKRNKGKKRR